MSRNHDPETIVALCGEAARAPGAPALAAPARAPLSHGALHAQVGRPARALRAAGLERGDVAALVVDNGPEAAGGSVSVDARIAAMRDAYVLRPLDVSAALLTSEDYDAAGVPRRLWTQALRNVRSIPFAGEHEHLFLPPAVDHLADALRTALEGDAA